ncbi:hypothetical protein BJ508DRAFT_366176 [Ascobolus immersus RN42]|uniref:Aminoglycoside phosphotransferase domain-containing protein n=1 Tax=Ascobolus immersus RN42 TaxID=1160509 RepID=A0A3N4HMR3_ASCIM|nr:hypothetical protein BJ508DRAFT_366176 [Ascobolus immersus RN42]
MDGPPEPEMDSDYLERDAYMQMGSTKHRSGSLHRRSSSKKLQYEIPPLPVNKRLTPSLAPAPHEVLDPNNVHLRHGLGWRYGWDATMPVWTAEPDVEVIQRIAKDCLQTAEDVTVSFLAKGSFNKAYVIKTGADDSEKEFVFRVALPLYPHYKTASEVANLLFLRKHTTIPVPQVIAYNSSADTSDNELGFEWILMERVKGVPLRKLWRRSTELARLERVVERVAGFVKQLQDIRFPAVGSLYREEDLPTEQLDATHSTIYEGFRIGPIVSTSFCWNLLPYVSSDVGPHARDVGPFKTDLAFMEAVVGAQCAELREVKQRHTADSDASSIFEGTDIDNIPAAEVLCERLQSSFLAKIYSDIESSDGYVLRHHDLHAANIMVDEQSGTINGILDWEFIATVPHWMEDRYPLIVRGPEVDQTEPEPYSREKSEPRDNDPWMQWARMQLRPVYDRAVGKSSVLGASDQDKFEFKKILGLVAHDANWVNSWCNNLLESKGVVSPSEEPQQEEGLASQPVPSLDRSSVPDPDACLAQSAQSEMAATSILSFPEVQQDGPKQSNSQLVLGLDALSIACPDAGLPLGGSAGRHESSESVVVTD